MHVIYFFIDFSCFFNILNARLIATYVQGSRSIARITPFFQACANAIWRRDSARLTESVHVRIFGGSNHNRERI